MHNRLESILALPFVIALAACAETGGSTPAPTASAQISSGSAADEGACLSAVAQQTGNAQATVISSQFSQANTDIIIGVGPQQARWRCLVSGGVVAEVTSLTDEGAL